MEPVTFRFDFIDTATPEETQKEAVTEDPLFEHRVVEIFRNYLKPLDSQPTSLTQTVIAITDILRDPPAPRGYSNELHSFWRLCLSTAEQIPHDHAFHLKLVRLLVSLRHSPKTNFNVHWGESDKYQYILEFNLLSEVLRESLHPAYNRENEEETRNPEAARRWINTNAFCAHLNALDGVSMSAYCTWAMQGAFMSCPSTDHEALDCHVSAAAQWILHSGQCIFQQVLVPPEDEEMGSANEGWTLEDWHRWKAGFQSASREESLHLKTRDLAKRSANLMDAFEGSMARD